MPESKDEIEAINEKFPNPNIQSSELIQIQNKVFMNSAFTLFIKDWEIEESNQMLKYLYSRASIPEYQCRFVWQPNSIAFWDNRACQHYASDYWPEIRKVERVTIVGDRPYQL